MKKSIIITILLFFILGWIANNTYSSINSDLEYFEFTEYANQTNKDWASFLQFTSKERNSPKDRISEEQIHVKSDKIVIDLENAEWSRLTDTNSMDPILDSEANAIHIIPKDSAEVQIGDIIAYRSKLSTGTIIHRVVEISKDDKGIYFRTKGDNIPYIDPEKIRFDQVERILVAIIY